MRYVQGILVIVGAVSIVYTAIRAVGWMDSDAEREAADERVSAKWLEGARMKGWQGRSR